MQSIMQCSDSSEQAPHGQSIFSHFAQKISFFTRTGKRIPSQKIVLFFFTRCLFLFRGSLLFVKAHCCGGKKRETIDQQISMVSFANKQTATEHMMCTTRCYTTWYQYVFQYPNKWGGGGNIFGLVFMI
jgi:hypothetical protein